MLRVSGAEKEVSCSHPLIHTFIYFLDMVMGGWFFLVFFWFGLVFRGERLFVEEEKG